jgi:hydrogenase maturation protease
MAEWTDPKRVYVLVCGERLRGDDAAAVLAAQMLPADVLAPAEVIEVGLLSVEAVLDVPEGVAVVVADTAIGIAAGEVVVLPLSNVARSTGSGAALASSHSLPPDQVLALAEALRGALPRGSFVGIGGAEFGFGEGLSAPVAAGLPAFVTAIAEAIRNLAAALP